MESGDYLIDLIDWCYRKLVKLAGDAPEEKENKLERPEEFASQVRELDFAMGIETLSIIQFITDHLQEMTLAVIQQLVEQCDIFCVLVPLMEKKPWIKHGKAGKMIFENQIWQKVKDHLKVPKVEAQIWLTVYNLFMNPDVRGKYELSSYRKQNLLRLRKFINETLVDQIPVLGSLLRSLEELSLIGDNLPSKISAFAIHQLPELQDKINYKQDWNEIAAYQKANFLIENPEEQKKAAELMMSGIDDFFEEPICSECGEPATNRCSKCHNEWYCSRKCQVAAWKRHKQVCALLAEGKKETTKEESKTQGPKIVDITEG